MSYNSQLAEQALIIPQSEIRLGQKTTRLSLFDENGGPVPFSGKDDEVINVANYKAKGDNVTDDTTAILSAIAAAKAKGPGTIVFFPAVTSIGYKVLSTIDFGATCPWMLSPIVFYGRSQTAMTVGGSGVDRPFNQHQRILVRRDTTSGMWIDANEYGVKLINHNDCYIELSLAAFFTTGVQIKGDAAGFSYNQLSFGKLLDNQIAVELAAYNVGWVNENTYWGGHFNCSSTTYDGLSGRLAKDRIGVKLGLGDSTYLSNNSNIFNHPSFELAGRDSALFVGTPIQILAAGMGNDFNNCRHESPDPIAVDLQNNASPPRVTFSYDEINNVPMPVETGAYRGTIVEKASTRTPDAAKRAVFRSGPLHKLACYSNGSTNINVPGMAIQTSGSSINDSRFGATTAITINADSLRITSSVMLGVYVSTRKMKRFTLVADADNNAGRFRIRPYDSSGTPLTSAGIIHSDLFNVSSLLHDTLYGGSYGYGADNISAKHFTVSDDTDYMFVGICGGSNPALIRSFSIYALDHDYLPATWLPWPDNGENYGTTPPTAGTWEVGRKIWNSAPSTSGPVGWICTAAGTPGTWRSFGDVTGGVQIDSFVSSGTYTKPTGAKTLRVTVINGAPGGGSGRRGAAGTVRCGGGGSGGAGFTFGEFDAADITSTVTVTVGAGGTGGAAVTADNTDGNNGGAGAISTFGAYLSAAQGSSGSGGTNATGVAGTGGSGLITGSAGGTASTTGLVGGAGASAGGAGGGGAGGGISSANVAANGGNGGTSRTVNSGSTSGGVVDTTTPSSGTAPAAKGFPGNGGGGGAASITTAAQAGANGSGYGGGGGGGGASLNGNNSGAGGNGTSGLVLVVTTF